MCLSVFTLSNMNISAASGPITTKFYLTHHWGRRNAALCFWPDRIRPLVSMATDRSNRLKMGKKHCEHSSAFIVDRVFFNLTGNKNNHNISAFQVSSNFRQI